MVTPSTELTVVAIITPLGELSNRPSFNLYNVSDWQWNDGDQQSAILKTETDPITQILGRDASVISFGGIVYTENYPDFDGNPDQEGHKLDPFALLREYKRLKEPLNIRLVHNIRLGAYWCTKLQTRMSDLRLGTALSISYTLEFLETIVAATPTLPALTRTGESFFLPEI